MAWHHRDQGGPVVPPAPHPTVRVLRDDAELAAAAERAAESQRRLQARLESRAARDAWTAQRRSGQSPGDRLPPTDRPVAASLSPTGPVTAHFPAPAGPATPTGRHVARSSGVLRPEVVARQRLEEETPAPHTPAA